MSVPTSAAVCEPSAALATPHAVPGRTLRIDARWEAWIERGRQHDLAVKRKLRIALLCAAAIGLLVVIFFGVATGAR